MKRWPTKPLGKLIAIEKGKKAPGVFSTSTKTSLRYFQIEDLRPNTKIKYCEPFTCPRATKSDAIVAWDGANAGTVSCNLDGHIGSTLAILRPIEPTTLSAPFLSRFLEGNFDYLQKTATGATIPHISKGALAGLKIPLPPLAEQERIVKLLDEADELRVLRSQADHRAATLIPALFHEMFGDMDEARCCWPKESLGQLVSIESTLVDPRSKEYQDLQHIGADRIERDIGKLLPSKTAKEDGLISAKFLFDERDVLYSKIRPNLRKVALPTGRGLCSADMYPIRPGQKLKREFLWAYLLSDYFTDRAVDLSARANMPKLNRVQLDSIQAPVPPLPLQNEFAQQMTEIRELETSQATSRSRLDALFQSMLHRAFNGEL